MDNIKRTYFSLLRKMLIVMEAAGKTTLDVTMIEEPNQTTLQEFVTQLGPQYEYTVVHRGMVRIRRK